MLHSEANAIPDLGFTNYFSCFFSAVIERLVESIDRKGEVNLLREPLMTAYCSILSMMA